jgi:hypothetical protein
VFRDGVHVFREKGKRARREDPRPNVGRCDMGDTPTLVTSALGRDYRVVLASGFVGHGSRPHGGHRGILQCGVGAGDLARRLKRMAPPHDAVEHGRACLDKIGVIVQRFPLLHDAEIRLH